MTQKARNDARKVVVTGSALATPAGYTVAENSRVWREGVHTFSEITRFNTKGSSVRFAGECPPPDVKKLPDRKVQKILRRKDVISLLTTLDAAASAGIQKGMIDPERFGMYVGAGSTQIGDLTPYFTLVAQCADLHTGSFDSALFGAKLMDLVNPLVVLQTLMNNGLCFGTMTLDIRGVNSNFMDFQVAGLRAVGEAFRSIAEGRADVVIAGGISGPVEPFQLAEGVHSGYLARTRELTLPLGEVVKPYDRDRVGAILSEGSAYLVLEDEAHAVRRGATILGRIEGYHLASDGSFDFGGKQDSPGLGRTIEGALVDAGRTKGDLGFLVGHGNGSLHADGVEAKAYASYFGNAAKTLPMMSPKAVLGDMCEAGGVLALILALETLATGDLPPTHNFRDGDAFSSGLGLASAPQKIRAPRGIVTSRNFLGLSASVVVAAA